MKKTPMFEPPPPVMRSTVFGFKGWSGWDAWKSFLPEKWQAIAVAKKLIGKTGPYKGWDFSDTMSRLVIEMPTCSYRVIDSKGNVKACAAVRAGGAT